MKIEELLNEKRSNPNLNPKVNVMDMLSLYGGSRNTYVHFSDINKVGVNPRTMYKYNTPLGVYGYPISHVRRMTNDFTNNAFGRLEYASDKKYVFVISYQPTNPLVVQSYRNYERDSAILVDYFQQNGTPNLDYRLKVDRFNRMRGRLPEGERIWELVYTLIKTTSRNHPSMSYMLFYKLLGYDMVIDMGDGVIHPNEPTQAVFFNLPRVRVLDLTENRETLPQDKQEAIRDLTISPTTDMRVVRRAITDVNGNVGVFHDALQEVAREASNMVSAYEDFNSDRDEENVKAYLRGVLSYLKSLRDLGIMMNFWDSDLVEMQDAGDLKFFGSIVNINASVISIFGELSGGDSREFANKMTATNDKISDFLFRGDQRTSVVDLMLSLKAPHAVFRTKVKNILNSMVGG